MPCGCAKNQKQYQVVLNGKVIYGPVASKPTADGVARRYPGAEVKELPATAAPKASSAAPTSPSARTR